MKSPSVSDIVFFMVASTLCYLAIVGKPVDPQFLVIVGNVFGAFYVHKAQTKNKQDTPETSILNAK